MPYHKMEDYNQRLWSDAASEDDDDNNDDVSLFSHHDDYYIANAASL